MAEQPIALLPLYQGWVCLSGCLRKALLGEGATRPPTTYETIRGANDLPKITYTPSYQEKGRPEVNARLLVCAKG